MAITKMEGRTFEMLARDKRVKAIRPYGGTCVNIELADGWGVPEGEGRRALRLNFDNWEAARNWVRKAVQEQVDA
jgi:hypothetical protein